MKKVVWTFQAVTQLVTNVSTAYCYVIFEYLLKITYVLQGATLYRSLGQGWSPKS